MTGPTPIPTTYAGVKFRSRLEARWAVFFDACGLTWEFEPEGFRLPGGWYLPDFYLRDLGYYLEIKPTYSAVAHGLVCELDEAINSARGRIARGALMISGRIPLPGDVPNMDTEAFPPWCLTLPPPEGSDEFHIVTGWGDCQYAFCVARCGHCVSLQYEGRGDRAGCRVRGHVAAKTRGRKYHSGNHPRIRWALAQAHAHRFWDPQ